MKCIVEGCDRRQKYKSGLCNVHYLRQTRYGRTHKIRERITEDWCQVDGCEERRKYNTGYCQKHHLRFTRYGRTETIVNRGAGYHINHAGYVMIYVDGKPKFEHVHLAELALGKPLPPKAEVHHMNKAKWDNHTPYNLVICPDRAYHMLLHKRMRELGYENN